MSLVKLKKSDGSATELQGDSSGYPYIAPLTTSSQIDVAKMTKGTVTTSDVLSGTVLLAEIDCAGFNALLVHVNLSDTGTPNWTITVQGSLTTGGTFVAWNEISAGALVAMSSGALTADAGFIFKGIPDYVKIMATENSGTGTCTVAVQPLNV